MKKHVVVFDLDETLGYFSSFGAFCSCLNYVLNDKHFYQNNFNDLLDLYPEFLRPNIFKILSYLKNKKKLSACNDVIIYTNNQGPKDWAIQIKDYLNAKINYQLFTKIIAAFKVNGKQIEICRTSHEKNVGDFLKCTNLPLNTQIFFLDDQYHMKMEDKNVYYINVFPYIFDLPWNIMIERFANKFKKIIINKNIFEKNMISSLNKYNITLSSKSFVEHEAEHVIGLKIISHLKDFFKDVKNKSVKNKVKNKKTRKK
jgi:hypothetical protein